MTANDDTFSRRVTLPGQPDTEAVEITFDGDAIAARKGETIAAALTAAGVTALRHTSGGNRRGMFCGMGVCQECLVEVDGRPNRRACMTIVTQPVTVRSGQANPEVAVTAVQTSAPDEPDEPIVLTPQVLVIGGGAAGLSAAIAATEAGAQVTVLDERSATGGQFYKQPASLYAPPGTRGTDPQFEAGRQLIERARLAGINIIQGAEVWGAFEPMEIAALTPNGPVNFRPGKLIVATGAYERGLAVPGWTLPGVMTTGAAQTLLRSYRVLPGRRVLVAGNGPLNIQVALEMARAGAKLVGVAEAAALNLGDIASAIRMALAAPKLAWQGFKYLAGLRRRGIPFHRGEILTGIAASGSGLRATLASRTRGGFAKTREIQVDIVCMGYGFLPSNEVLRLLGARHEYDPKRRHLATVRNADCETTITGVYAAGDCCGLGGAAAAVEEGVIAGAAAASALNDEPADAGTVALARRDLERHRRFQTALWSLFAAPGLTTELADADTTICRCEEVALGALTGVLEGEAVEIGSLKRSTRAGMGRCQGRYCSANLASLIAAKTGGPVGEMSFFAPRPPIKPVAISDLTARPAGHEPAE